MDARNPLIQRYFLVFLFARIAPDTFSSPPHHPSPPHRSPTGVGSASGIPRRGKQQGIVLEFCNLSVNSEKRFQYSCTHMPERRIFPRPNSEFQASEPWRSQSLIIDIIYLLDPLDHIADIAAARSTRPTATPSYPNSSARALRASRSNTALTMPVSVLSTNACATSTYSETITRAGMSVRFASS